MIKHQSLLLAISVASLCHVSSFCVCLIGWWLFGFYLYIQSLVCFFIYLFESKSELKIVIVALGWLLLVRLYLFIIRSVIRSLLDKDFYIHIILCAVYEGRIAILYRKLFTIFFSVLGYNRVYEQLIPCLLYND